MTPIFIVSKGRHDCHTTSSYLAEMRRPHFIVVEPSEVDAYTQAANAYAKVIPLNMNYKADYELLDDRGLTASTGPGPARNFAWDMALESGHCWHWVMDDNIDGFFRLNRNLKVPCKTSRMFDAMEDFCSRFTKVTMAGPNYFKFIERRAPRYPFRHNTRIYSCNLIRNSAPFRWRGRYNEDTILSLDMLKAGYSTIQFNAFLQDKRTTQQMKGVNTGEFYAKEGTLLKSQMLVDAHPDVSSVKWRFSRWHHHVDYTRFQTRPLELREEWRGRKLPPDEYGMKLQKLVGDEWSDVTMRDDEARYAPSLQLKGEDYEPFGR